MPWLKIKRYSPHKFSMSRLGGECGNSMITVLVITAVSCLSLTYISSNVRNQRSAQVKTTKSNDRASLRQYILDAVDCAETNAGLNKICSGSITIKSKSGSNLTEIGSGQSSRTLGSYKIRAFCQSCSQEDDCEHGHKIVIQYSLSQDGSWQDLFSPSNKLPNCEVTF